MMMAMQLPQPGQSFERKYVIRQTLGEGGFAMVYRATDEEIQRDVAIKILTPRDGSYPKKVVARFMREARVIAGLQDPHTIKLFEFGESSEGLLYMVFQYVSGLDLLTIVRRRGPLEPSIVAHVTAQVLSALAEAHAAGILHRDIKPANILIHEYMGDEYNVKLLDFGIAKIEDNPGNASLTKTGALIGTPRYMAPEQVFGEQMGPWSDIYSLGLVAYEMLVGQPAVGGTKEQMLRAHISEEPILLPYDVAWLSLRQVIERMLARMPRDRFQSASAAHKALRFAMANPQNPLPSGAVSGNVITGPIPALPYSSGAYEPPDGHFSSGFVTPNPDFSSGHLTPHPDFSSGHLTPHPDFGSGASYTTGAGHSSGSLRSQDSEETPPANSRGIIAGGIALSIVVAGLAVYFSRAEPPVAEPGEVPDVLLTVKDEPKPTADRDTGTVSAADAATPPAIDPLPVATRDGCGNEYHWQDERFMRVEAGNGRSVQVFLPKRYRPQKKYPVVIALQSSKWDIKQYVHRAHLHQLANRQQAIILGPEPADRYAPWVAADDIEVLRAVVPQAAERFCIDQGRVFVVGTGAGGTMARDLACQMPLSGIATTGDGELVNSHSCVPSVPVPMLWIIGKQDFFAPLAGGRGCAGGDFLSADEHDELWTERYRCDGAKKEWFNKRGTQCWSWECRDATYGACRAAGGHYLKDTSWDVLDPAGCKAPMLDLSVGPTVWEFFETHGKRLEVPEPQ